MSGPAKVHSSTHLCLRSGSRRNGRSLRKEGAVWVCVQGPWRERAWVGGWGGGGVGDGLESLFEQSTRSGNRDAAHHLPNPIPPPTSRCDPSKKKKKIINNGSEFHSRKQVDKQVPRSGSLSLSSGYHLNAFRVTECYLSAANNWPGKDDYTTPSTDTSPHSSYHFNRQPISSEQLRAGALLMYTLPRIQINTSPESNTLTDSPPDLQLCHFLRTHN